MKKLFLITTLISIHSLFNSTQAQDRSSMNGGKIKIYFNSPVDNTVSSTINATYLNHSMADTLAAYINRAKYTIDIAQYDYSASSTITPVTTAINAAYTRGVIVRWIYDGSQSNSGLANLNAGIHKLGSPTTSAYGIMHDKFMVIDGNSSNHTDPFVWTGSPDWGSQQFNTCQNNAIIIQDYSLAQAYIAQFNQMWGGSGAVPVTANEKFGPDKISAGPHSFVIAGKTIELYFSPKDGVNSHILSSIASANTDMYFGVYTFTESTNATNIVAKKNAGVYVAGIVDQYSNGTSPTAYNTLTAGLGSQLITYANSTYVYHNKYLLVDPNNFCSDPQVLTGSHNWTSAADTKNDENTLIIHSDTIANIYYQAFHQNFTDLSGTLSTIANCTSNNAPVANFTPSVSTVCAGQAVTLTDNSTNTPTSWAWTMIGGTPATSTVQNPSVTYSTAGTYTISLVSHNSGGNSSSVSKTITVTSCTNAPVANFTPSATTVCTNQAVTLTDNSTNTPTSWAWTMTGGTPATSTVQNPSVTYSTAGTYTISLVSHNSGGNSTSVSKTITVTSCTSAPVANFTPSATTACTGQAINLTDNSTNAPTSWTWTMTGATPAIASTQNPSVTYNSSGTFTINLVSTNSFGSSTAFSKTITVNSTPSIPTISSSGNVLTSSATAGNQWYLNGTLISGATSQTYTVAAVGSYTVEVTNTFACSATSTATNITTTGIDAIANNVIVNIFPNPSDGMVTINFPYKSEHTVINIINGIGQQVYMEEITDCPENCTRTVDMKSFKNGIYLIKIVSNENSFTKKVLLMK
jgi:PKD repeat protein